MRFTRPEMMTLISAPVLGARQPVPGLEPRSTVVIVLSLARRIRHEFNIRARRRRRLAKMDPNTALPRSSLETNSGRVASANFKSDIYMADNRLAIRIQYTSRYRRQGRSFTSALHLPEALGVPFTSGRGLHRRRRPSRTQRRAAAARVSRARPAAATGSGRSSWGRPATPAARRRSTWMVKGGGVSGFGTGWQQPHGAAAVPERRRCSSRVRRAAQARSLAPQAARAASCGATKAAL